MVSTGMKQLVTGHAGTLLVFVNLLMFSVVKKKQQVKKEKPTNYKNHTEKKKTD